MGKLTGVTINAGGLSDRLECPDVRHVKKPAA